MARVAGGIFAREIIKHTIVFYSLCLKKYWKRLDKYLWRGLFCESFAITHHSLIKMNQTPCQKFEEGVDWIWKDEKTKANMKELLFQIKAN